MRRTSAILAGLTFLAATASAQNIIMKDGRVIATKGLRRQGDTIMAMNPAEPGKPPLSGEAGFPLSQIQKLDLPEPAALRAGSELITQGKYAEAIAQLNAALAYYEGFRDAPGSWWSELALTKVTALNSQGRDKEAEPIVDQLVRSASDPEIIRAAKVQVASNMARRGHPEKALEICEEVIRDSTKPETLAAAAVSKGQSHLGLKQWDDAILSFLQIPVLYPKSKVLLPQAMLGVGEAFFGMEDYQHAKERFNELITTYGSAAESSQAKAELEKIAKIEKALEPPK